MTRCRAALLVAMLCVVCCAALATSANAKVPAGFYGVHAWNHNADDFEKLDAAGIRAYRSVFSWAEIEPTLGVKNWASIDQIMTSAATHHIDVLPVVIGVPRWISSNQLYAPRSAAVIADFSDFAADIAKRYGPGGEFWLANPMLVARPIRSYQVWNEQNLPGYWSRRPNAKQYMKLVKGVNTAIKKVDSSAKIVLGGLPESRLGVPMVKFLQQIYKTKNAKKYFDGVGLHPYSVDQRGVLAALKRVRNVQKQYRDSAAKVYFTELGWASSGPKSNFTTTKSGQRSRLSKVMTMLAKYRKRYKIAAAYWFAIRDRKAYPGERELWVIHTGLFDRKGKAKPAWTTYKSLVRKQQISTDPYAPTTF